MDDMVAELTLRLINETDAGFSSLNADMAAVQGEVAGLRDAFGGLAAEISELPTGIALTAGLTEVTSEAGLAAAAVAGIGAAAEADIGKIGDLKAAMADMSFHDTFVPPAADDGRPGFVPPGYNLPPDQSPPDQPGDGGGQKKQDDSGGHFGIMDLLAFTDIPEALKNNADFQGTLAQITNTEKLHGDAADAEQARIAQNVVIWAQQYHAKSQELVDAYKFLITTGLDPHEVDALMPALAEAATAHGIDVSDMQGAVFALADSFKISPDQMGAALAQMGYATKMGHFGAESFGMFLPQLGGALATAGDTGPDVADDTFAAMETIIKNVSIPSEAATDYTDMIHYIGSQHAMRTFMQMSRMMMPQMRDLFDKYDIAPADILAMQNDAVAEGKDPVQTILDYVHAVTAKMTPTDRNAVISDYFTNQQGGDAVRSLMLHWSGYQDDISTLKGIGQGTLDDDFKAAVQNASGDMNLFAENLAELNRDFGGLINYTAIQPLNTILSPPGMIPPTGNPNLDPVWDSGSRFQAGAGRNPAVDVNLHVHVSADGTVTATPAGTPAPGVNLRVNQGTVLNTP